MGSTTTRLALPYPVSGDTPDVPRDMQALATRLDGVAALPVGMVFCWSAATPPTGALLCDGASLPRSAYPALFALIGTAFGSADSSHFTLPDLRDRFPAGASAAGQAQDATHAGAPGAVGGEAQHLLTLGELPSHTHGLHVNVAPSGGGDGSTVRYGVDSTWQAGVTVAAGGGGVHENRPPFLALNWCIQAT